MCVAIYKPKDIQTPSLATLEKCWQANPDGAGFALLTGAEKYAIEIHKGYMTWKHFVTAYEKYGLADFAGNLLLHFRIATHGAISSGNTHPFAFTQDIRLLQHTNVLTNYALIHNGMLPLKPVNEETSDTMELCRMIASKGLHRNVAAIPDLIPGMMAENRIAVMTRDKVHLFGQWENIDGVYYSNLHWDWPSDDYCFIPTKKELRKLNRGICPYCHGQVAREDDMFYCFMCGDVWSVPINHQHN